MKPLTPDLENALRDYLPSARWFMSKHKTILRIIAIDRIPLYCDEDSQVEYLILKVHSTDSTADLYGFPLRIDRNTLDSKTNWHDAFQDPACALFLTQILRESRNFRGYHGRLESHPLTTLLPVIPSDTQSEFEQSNSAVVVGNLYFCKLYRHLEAGPHPEIEIGSALTQAGYSQSPRIIGSWRYRTRQGKCYTLGILQEWIPSALDAWQWTGSHPDTAQTARLGQLAASMHTALARHPGAHFAPEPWDNHYRRSEHKSFLSLVRQLNTQIQSSLPSLPPKEQGIAHALQATLPTLPILFSSLRSHSDLGLRQRIHGDFHLGQVLRTNNDFKFVDFEGEPARHLRERRIKHSPLRDVAGMVRSFAYAEASFPNILATYPADTLANSFINTYFDAQKNSPFLPRTNQARQDLLNSFLLEKALYEVSYELTNRPTWFRIPAQGLLELTQKLTS